MRIRVRASLLCARPRPVLGRWAEWVADGLFIFLNAFLI
jgi:hypothetical protein